MAIFGVAFEALSAMHHDDAALSSDFVGVPARGDAAAGRVTEVSGWVVPESVAQYAALAAQFA